MKLRKIAAVLIAIVVLCAAPIGGLVGVDCMSFFTPKAEAAGKTYKVGDIVEFGSYPQSRVTNSSSFPPSIKSRKTGSAMAITAAQGLVVPWLRRLDEICRFYI